MRINRREFVIGGTAAFGMTAFPAFAKIHSDLSSAELFSGNRADASFSMLNRLTFGVSPDEQALFNKLGLKKYLETQLNPKPDTDPAANGRIAKATLHIEYKAKETKPGDKPDEYYPAVKEDRPLLTLGEPVEELWKLTDIKKVSYFEQIHPAQEVRAAAWIRAVYSKWQLREVMAEFWHNHFNVNTFQEGRIAAVFPVYDAIMRKNCFGNFRVFLEDVSQSTAMLLYLNNAKSKASPANENYARELFELHTLGADHYYNNLYNRWREVPGALQGRPIGYIDEDVYEAARSFTGWTIEDGTNTGRGTIFPNTGKFTYFDGWHDNYQKRVLGNDFDPNMPPMSDGKKVLDLVAAHPGTAVHLSTKLCRRFVSDNPPQSLVARVARVWQKYIHHPEQIKYVLRAIILSPEFREAEGRKVKRPFEYVVSFLRATGADFMPNDRIINSLSEAGYKQFGWPTPTGHPDVAEYWLNTNTVLSCWNIILDLVRGTIKDVNFNIATQTPPVLKTSRDIISYWVKCMVGKEPGEVLVNALMQYMPDPLDAHFIPNIHANDVNDSMKQMVATIAMLPDFQVR